MQIEPLFRSKKHIESASVALSEPHNIKSRDLSHLLGDLSLPPTDSAESIAESDESNGTSSHKRQPTPPKPSAWSKAPVRSIPGLRSGSQTKAGITATTRSFQSWGATMTTTAASNLQHEESSHEQDHESSIHDIRVVLNSRTNEMSLSPTRGRNDVWTAQWPRTKTTSHLQTKARQRYYAQIFERDKPLPDDILDRDAHNMEESKVRFDFQILDRSAILSLPLPPIPDDLPRPRLPWDEDEEEDQDDINARDSLYTELK